MMECNKEEAIRARDLAEKKMQNKDFAGARKIAQKAQNLFPELENISQMLTVCDVHCSASTKVCGELDWYGILQVETTADDSSIKKQYRKLALLLHPDKNQFAGAEAAFKLIGEANVILSDKTKRHLYDIKRKALTMTAVYRQPAPQMRKSYHDSCTYSAVNLNGLNHQQQQPFATAQTFWTICPVCRMRYQYYKSILNKPLRCQNCLKTFIAYDLNANVPPSGVNSNPHEQVQVKQACNINQQNQFGNASSSMGFKGSVSAGPNVHFEYRGGPANMTTNHKANDKGNGRNEAKFEKNPREQPGKPSTANASKKRSRKAALNSSDSESADSDSTDIEVAIDPQANRVSSSAPRRSSRLKQNINYNEVEVGSEDEDDFRDPPTKKKLRCKPSDNADGHSEELTSKFNANHSTDDKTKNNCKDDASSGKELPNGSKRVNTDARQKSEPDVATELESGSTAASYIDSSTKASAEVHAFVYPDPEFCDFDKHRHVNAFAVNQIWAIYDNLDGMPRFYALIRQVYHRPHFKLRFTWLEHNPLNDVETSWCDVELPIGCGNYVLGSSDSTEDQLMFSHLVSWEKGKKKNSYNIYPTRGEVWALFKDWNMGWSSDSDNHRLYEYEVIEVLSDFSAGNGISVVPLVKIDGFVSLFMRAKEMVPYVIPPDEILRFSHNIPTHRLTGTEKEGLPHGCLELDPASLPNNFSESFPSVGLCIGTSSAGNLNESCGQPTTDKGSGVSRVQDMENEKSQNLSHADVKGFSDTKQYKESESHQSEALRHAQNETKQTEVNISEKDKLDPRSISDNVSDKENSSATLSSRSPIFEYPEAEFHNFDEEKSIDNVQRGQIWALYSDIDKCPKYYVWVKKVDLEELKVHVSWLEACPVSVEEQRWIDVDLPITCGTFKVERDNVVFDNTGSFSHLVKAKPTGKNRYVVLPQNGEIWAVYKNWSVGWNRSDFQNCEYDVVEICECTDAGISATILMKVNGYRAVFRRGIEGKSVTMRIPADEYLRFSHKIPSFLLSHERGGKLQGCWELDTASVPDILLFLDDE